MGGTKIEAIVLDGNGAEVFRHRIIAPQGNYNDTIEAIAYLVNRADNEVSALTKLGIGIPGSLSPKTNLVRNANSTWLIGKPLKQDLKKIYLAGGEPTYIKNYLSFLRELYKQNPECEVVVNSNLKKLPDAWKIIISKFKNCRE